MKRKRYSPAFKQEAVKVLIMDGVPTTELAKKLDVSRTLLYSWKKKYLADIEGTKLPDSASPAEMAKEMDQLRKELAKANRINEILKKTIGYFSKEES